jgi:spermidine/putrescine transport system substrate-binding protein
VSVPEPSLRFLCWDGYQDPAITTPFLHDTGFGIDVETLLSDHEAADRVLALPGRWDLLNINSPHVKERLFPRSAIKVLDPVRFGSAATDVPTDLRRFFDCATGPKREPLGVCQRFGPFNLVVDVTRISANYASDQGFHLAEDRSHRGRFGILAYEDFNVQHIAIGAGLNPFERLAEGHFTKFAQTARRWFSSAALVTQDHQALNGALIRGEIGFYLSGGVYTASCARLAGHSQIHAVTPKRGPIDGKGAIAFVEVNAALSGPKTNPRAEDFLEYLGRAKTALRASLAGGSANPVAQMFTRSLFDQFTIAPLDAMQWSSLEEEMARCSPYRAIPDYERLVATVRAERRRGRS